MEKYLIIVIIGIILYTVYNLCTTTEAFGDAVTVDGIDDNNAINTLAKIAKDLQEGGGLKVKGNLDTAGKLLVGTAGNLDGDILQIFTKKDKTKYVYANANNEFGMWDTNNGGMWSLDGNAGHLKLKGGVVANAIEINDASIKGKTTVGGDLQVTGKTSVTNLDVNGKLTSNGLGFVNLYLILGGSFRAPIRDKQGNTFPSDKWVCTSNFIHNEGISWTGGITFVGNDNNWWIGNPHEGSYTHTQITLMPRTLFSYASVPKNGAFNSVVNKNGGLFMFDENGNRVAHPNP